MDVSATFCGPLPPGTHALTIEPLRYSNKPVGNVIGALAMNPVAPPGVHRAMNSVWPLGRMSKITLRDEGSSGSRIITPAFAKVLVFTSVGRLIQIQPSPSNGWDT